VKRLPTILLLAVSITLILGVLPASAVVSSVTASEVSVVAGKVRYVAGSISCTNGMKFNVRANVRDGSGNIAVGKAGGTCTGSSQPWKTGQIDSGTGFSCGEQVLVRGQARTTQDGAKRFIHDTTLQACSSGAPRNPGDILLLETISSIVDEALASHGYTFTDMNTDVFTGIDYSSYETVVVAMDGGDQDLDDLTALRTGVIDAGKRLVFVGGSADLDFASAVDSQLLSISQGDIDWDIVAGSPDLTVLLPAHGLAAGVPATYDFVNPDASFYMAIPDAADHTAVAKNGDNVTNLLHRDFGAGSFVWFTNSPQDIYWLNGTDLDVMQAIVGNALTLPD
jgi:hypothetical protein